MSRESDYAWRAARFYGPVRAQMSRQGRIDFVEAQIATLESLTRDERATHKASCAQCQARDFCLTIFSITREQSDRADKISFLRGLIGSEVLDQVYAQAARLRPVDYKQHVDGFCRYWQNVRHRKFEAVGGKCEQCGHSGPLEAHHRHYDTLGFEELHDLQALCHDCHQKR
jgi:hypothetical protein